MTYTANLQLAAELRAVPSWCFGEGIIRAIYRAAVNGHLRRNELMGFYRKDGLRPLVTLACAASMERAEAQGQGKRAAKRAAAIEIAREQAEWFDACSGLTEADVDRFAEQRGEQVVSQQAGDFLP